MDVFCIDSFDIDSIECMRDPYFLYQQYQHICLTSVTRAKPKEKMEFPA